MSKKPSPVPSPCEAVLATERFECDAERLRNSERFSRSITPRGRRQARRRRIHRVPDSDQSSSKVYLLNSLLFHIYHKYYPII